MATSLCNGDRVRVTITSDIDDDVFMLDEKEDNCKKSGIQKAEEKDDGKNGHKFLCSD